MLIKVWVYGELKLNTVSKSNVEMVKLFQSHGKPWMSYLIDMMHVGHWKIDQHYYEKIK